MRQALALLLLLAGSMSGLHGTPAAAAEPDARDHFAAGTAAVRRGDFEAALLAYQAAEAAGLKGPAVAYNIGVCAWELGRLDEAEDAFLRAAASPSMAATAYLNLGLVSQRRGDDARARSWFQRAHDEAGDKALRQLAAAHLAEVSPAAPDMRPRAQPRTASETGRAVGFAILQSGYDDNVALVADGEIIGVTDTGSAFLEAQLAGAVPLNHGLRLEASAYLLRYPSLGEFDQSGGRVGLRARRPFGEWTGEVGVDLGLNRLDAERFEDRYGVTLVGLRALEGGWDMRVRYRYEDISGRGDFKALSGDRHELALRVRHGQPGRRVRMEYRLEANDRMSDAVSPDRHRLDADVLFDAPWNLQSSLGIGWRHSRYATSGGDRTERRLIGSAGLLGPLSNRLHWLVRVEFLDNDATLKDFDYRQRRAFAGIEAIF